MGNTVKIMFSAVTHTGSSNTVNSDRIYANGKFIHPSAADYAQISLESVDSKFFFALSGNMEDSESGISLMNDLKRFHQKSMSSSKNINVKLDELVQCVEQASNLIYSLSLGENGSGERKPNFAGILIDEGNIAAVNLGSYRIYKLEGDTFKLFVNDYKRAERLLKMGIISDEQAELLADQQKAMMEESRKTVKKSDIYSVKSGVTYLVCSTGLSDAVDEDDLYDALASGKDPDQIAGELVMEAVGNGSQEDVSALVIRITDAQSEEDYMPGPKTIQYKPSPVRAPARPAAQTPVSARKVPVDTGRIVSVIVLVFLAAAVVLGGYKLWTMLNPEAKNASADDGGSDLSNDDTLLPADESSISEDTDGAGSDTDGETAEGTGQDSGEASENTEDTGNEERIYTVQPGDMLMTIAKKFYGDESKYTLIMEANDIKDPNKISVGQPLIIPQAE